ncbi:GAF domain-containing protein [Limnobacter humi]|uniref:GAF domain-containing protein n=1 Tax=Limnobacter humi TaxID=1778671 RepID=A0ABT1WER2_9BURK|nr:GAF domain-containing protein [Limnobacter humi]MCQ8896011.1 GAF domain-containing protein [Limnobacter humi]
MKRPGIPDNEGSRTLALQQLGIMYTPSEARFDRITRLAMRHFNVPTALVSIVYKELQWFKSNQGLNACTTGREVSFCGHAILQDEPFIVTNALTDPRFADNPLVTNEPRIRFYAGQAIRDPHNVVLGTLCLIDYAPREFSAANVQDLCDFAKLVEAELAMGPGSSVVQALIEGLTEDQRIALIDPQIGSWNLRGIEAVLNQEFKAAGEDDHPISLIAIRLSDFDSLCARFGADRLLDFRKHVAAMVRDEIPASASLAVLSPSLLLAVCPRVPETDVRKLIAKISAKCRSLPAESLGVKTLIECRLAGLTVTGVSDLAKKPTFWIESLQKEI